MSLEMFAKWQTFCSGLSVLKNNWIVLSLNDEASLCWIALAFNLIGTNYRKTSNISRTLIGNKIVDNSDVVGASPVGAAPTTSSTST